ncbi:MAG: HAD-IIIA family hydrolase, partial [Desulfovermiculus sp.]
MPSAPIITNILLDRDGTIIFDRHYLADPQGICLLPGAVEGLQALTSAGLRLFLVTNQSGIGRGYFTLQDFDRVQARL